MFFPGLLGGNTQSASEKPQDWFSKALLNAGGGRSKAGVHVTPETAIGFIAVYACVKLLSESVAQLPCNLYRRLDNKGNRERATDHGLHDMIRHTPNGWMTAFDYHEYQQSSLAMRGNAYSYVERNGSGEITDIIPMQAAQTTVRVGADRRPVFDFAETGDTGVPFSKVHHVAAFKTNAYVGLSPIQAGREGLGLSMATEQHAAHVFGNGTQIRGVLERDFVQGIKSLNQDQVTKLKEDWKKLYAGIGGDDIAVLQDNFKFKSISMSNVDAEVLASRVHGINEVARLFNVPPHMIQLLDKATFSNIEHQGLQFVMYSLMPWLRRHEAAMMRDLLTAKERADGHYIEFNVSGLLRGDMQTRFESYAKGRQWGWLSVNDIRRMENLPPIKDGDKYLQPLNMIDAGKELPLPKAEKNALDSIRGESQDTGNQ